MKNIEKNNLQIQDILLSELNGYNTRINISIILITLILIIIPTLLTIKIFGLIGGLILTLLVLTLIVGLLFSVRMYNYNKILYNTNVWLLDCIINKKPLN